MEETSLKLIVEEKCSNLGDVARGTHPIRGGLRLETVVAFTKVVEESKHSEPLTVRFVQRPSNSAAQGSGDTRLASQFQENEGDIRTVVSKW